jgi:hypothetical protein
MVVYAIRLQLMMLKNNINDFFVVFSSKYITLNLFSCICDYLMVVYATSGI